MANLGKAVVELSADTARFTGDIGRAAVMFDKQMASMAATASKIGTAVGVASAVVGSGLALMVRNAIDTADAMGKLSQKVGITTEKLSELKLAAELGDLGGEGFEKGLREFNRSLVEAQDEGSKTAEVFKALGVDVKQGPEVALRQFAEAMSKLDDGQLKTAASMEILKKSGSDWIPTLNAGAKGFDDAAQKARGLGLVISGDFAKNAEAFNDNLKLMGKSVDALAISIAGPLVQGLSTLIGNLAEAATKNKLLWQGMMEGAKLAAATFAKFPKTSPFNLGGWASDAADALFQQDAQMRSMRGGAPIAIGGMPAASLPDAPNTEQLACTLSGGKWVNGKCVRETKSGGAAGKSPQQLLRELESQSALTQLKAYEDLENAAPSVKDYFENLRKGNEAQEQFIANMETGSSIRMWDDIASDVRDTTKELNAYNKAAEKTSDIGRELGLTFSSAFEDAILAGKKFSDVLGAIAQDIARIILRKTVTEPAANAVSQIVGKVDFGKMFGSMLPSFAVGTDYVPHDMVAQIHQGEKIIPAGQNAGGGVSVMQTIHIDSRSDQATIMQAVRAAAQQAEASILRSLQYNGQFAQAAGK